MPEERWHGAILNGHVSDAFLTTAAAARSLAVANPNTGKSYDTGTNTDPTRMADAR